MGKLKRILRHMFTTTGSGRRAFPEKTLQAIQDTIAEGERLHRAEVRLIIEPSLSLSAVLAGTTSRERAIELFSIHRIWDTEENCGILVYIELADHKVEIVADRGIHHLTSAEEWQQICRTMTTGFARGAYHDSVIAALRQLNAVLHEHLPDTKGQPNQLPDRPIML